MIKRNERITMTAALTVLLLLVTAQFCAAATWTVTSTEDSGSDTLRQALADAVDGDTIDFGVNGTIMLTSGQLTVDKSVSITVPSDQDLTVDGLNTTRVFYIAKGKTVTLSGLTISHGYALNGTGGGVYNAGTLTLNDCTLSDNSAMLGGGGVFTEGDLTITGCTLSGNKTGVTEDDYYGGGAVAAVFKNEIEWVTAHPTLTIDDSLLTGNEAPYGGGILISIDAGTGLSQDAWATVTVKNSTLSDNVATAPGSISLGGAMAISVSGDTIVSSADVTVENCTLSNNSATSDYYAMGGGIAIIAPSVPHYGILFLKNSTLSDNSALFTGEGGVEGIGGAIYLYGGTYQQDENTYYSSMIFLDNSTLSGNHDTYGVSGILNDGGKVELKNTILANDPSGANIKNEGLISSGDGIVISHGYNLSSDNDAGYLTEDSDQINIDPMLGPLADNGGPTLTHALLAGSPAIDAGNPNSIVIDWIASTVITTDQRGVARPQGENNDIGAFELEYSEFEYEWSGVLPPVNPDGTSIFKARSTIPVKFMLTGLSAGITDLEATLSYIKIGSASPGAVNESVSTSAATTGNVFRYDPASDEYIFNWSTKGLTQGAYRLYIDLGDGVERFVDVGLK